MGVLEIGTGRDSWSTEGLTVEYSRNVIIEICSSLNESLEGTPAIEAGGLLFGTRAGSKVRIEAFRPVPCEHALGPDFVLSGPDRAGLEKLAEAARADRDLKAYEAIGWYRGQRKGEIAFSEQDRELHDRYFRFPGQIALIFRRDASGVWAARIYAREPGSTIRGCERYFRCPSPPPAPPPLTAPPAADAVPAPAAPVIAAPADVAGSWRIPWKWLAAAALGLAVLAVALAVGWDYWSPPVQDPLALRAMDWDGQLFIEWDRNAPPIREGRSAVLDIVDGTERTTVPLNTSELRQGSVSYTRKSDLVNLRMTIKRSRFKSTQEFLRFVGQPVKQRPSPLEAQAIRERLDLALQIERLRQELKARDEELQRLQARLGKP